jgi:hypothetical protein
MVLANNTLLMIMPQKKAGQKIDGLSLKLLGNKKSCIAGFIYKYISQFI